jgi:tRNA nucleotidyltransferase/poly(A) polymerase
MESKNYFIFCCILATTCLLVSCSPSKDRYLTEFSNFVKEIETNYKQYTDEDWEQKEIHYQQYIGKQYQRFEHKFSDSDQEQIGKLKGKYQTIKVKYQAEKFIDNASKNLQQLKGVIEGVMESVEN